MHIAIKTRNYASRADATEAWNTWAAGRSPVTREAFLRFHESLSRDYPIENGLLVLPDGDHAFGALVIDEIGGYESPWPRIFVEDYARSEAGLYGADDMIFIYKLRARWRLVNKDHTALRRHLVAVLGENDRDNAVLNKQLGEWNQVLWGSGFPILETNDLRGVDLSGLQIRTKGERPVMLRQIDFRYAELHYVDMNGCNLYGSNFTGAKALAATFDFANCGTCIFSCADLMGSSFVCANVGSASFEHASLALSRFDGAACYGADFRGAGLRRSSFASVADLGGRVVQTDLTNVRWDETTQFEEVNYEGVLQEQNPELYGLLRAKREGITPQREALAAIEAKPGMFGFTVNLATLYRAVKRWLSARRA